MPCAQGYEVDVYESRPFIGGKVASWQKDGNHVEMGLHVVRRSAAAPTASACAVLADPHPAHLMRLHADPVGFAPAWGRRFATASMVAPGHRS